MFVGDAHHRRDAEPVGVFIGEGGHLFDGVCASLRWRAACCAPHSMPYCCTAVQPPRGGWSSGARKPAGVPVVTLRRHSNSACTGGTDAANHTTKAASTNSGAALAKRRAGRTPSPIRRVQACEAVKTNANLAARPRFCTTSLQAGHTAEACLHPGAARGRRSGSSRASLRRSTCGGARGRDYWRVGRCRPRSM